MKNTTSHQIEKVRQLMSEGNLINMGIEVLIDSVEAVIEAVAAQVTDTRAWLSELSGITIEKRDAIFIRINLVLN